MSESKSEKSQAFKRLPSNVVPSHYNLYIVPKLTEDYAFQGFVEVTVDVKEATQVVEFHAAALKIDTVSVRPKDTQGRELLATDVSLDEKMQTCSVKFASELSTGTWILSVRYTGDMSDKLCGFYRSKYTDVEGKERVMGVTQFEPTDARRALPCWDEPALKARFSVTLFVDPNLVCVSNMPCFERATIVEPEQDKGVQAAGFKGDLVKGKVRFSFEPSPIMSTYLLAWVIGEFDCISQHTKTGTLVNVYTPVGSSHLGVFSLDVAVRGLEFYNEWFDIPYPLPKVDLLAIPDFAAGAMENWGCITYREAALLIDEKQSSVRMKMRVARTVCHELAHMWFGNLVTFTWWSYLWLNEGFAHFMEHLAVCSLFPEWDVWTFFLADVVSTAQRLDSLATSHPIEVTVNHPDEINEIFDSISYAKGASVIRMLNATLGEKAFQAGLRTYLKTFAYSNATTQDLWTHLSKASNVDVSKFMHNWITEMGYPVVSVASTDKDGQYNLSQTRYLASGKPADGKDEVVWHVPLPGNSFLDKKHAVIPLGEAKQSLEQLDLNVSGSTFARFEYEADVYHKTLAPALSDMDAARRLVLVSDLYASCANGRIPFPCFMQFASAFTKESAYPVLKLLADSLCGTLTLHRDNKHEAYYKKIQAIVTDLFAHHLQQTGLHKQEGEKDQTTLTRATAFSALCHAGHTDTLKQCVEWVAKAGEKGAENPIPGDLRGSVYHAAVESGSEEAYELVLQLYRATDLSEEKRRCLAALGAAKCPKLLLRTLDWGVGRGEYGKNKEVRSQDLIWVFASVARGSPEGRDIAWKYLTEQWDAVTNIFNRGSGFLMSHVVGCVVSEFNSIEGAKQCLAFFEKNPFPPAARTIKQSTERTYVKAGRLAVEVPALKKWAA